MLSIHKIIKMNLEEIKLIVNSNLTGDIKKQLIIQVLAADEEVIPTLMSILNTERIYKKELLTAINYELSRASIYIEDTKENKARAKKRFNKTFVLGKIEEFYLKYKKTVSNCYK